MSFADLLHPMFLLPFVNGLLLAVAASAGRRARAAA